MNASARRRRDFFLDGATYFDFASNTIGAEQVQPYFSRRIGLSEAATPQRIDYGTKFNGQVGAQDVGFLHVRTADERDSGFIGEEFTRQPRGAVPEPGDVLRRAGSELHPARGASRPAGSSPARAIRPSWA